MKNFYITSTLPYTNSDPHIGFALEIIQTDVIVRYHKLLGEKVFFNTGTDEHGLKIYRVALEAGFSPQEYVDRISEKFKNLKQLLNVDYTYFIRTTDQSHTEAAQEFWRRCNAAGDIYKKNYKIKYCVGCELEKTDSELVNVRCPLHPNLAIEEIEEENYFFRFSKYQKPLLKYYKDNPEFVLPFFRFKEIIKFVEDGLKDFSISRLKSKMPWGVPVPDDDEHSMFVWFDALVGYISALGWPSDMKKVESYWPGVQTAGKDNLRQQSAIWQAMLMSAGLPNSKQILIHGFVTAEGQKMSKSLGNVVDPYRVVEKYGTDVVRYYLLREIPSGEDGDFSEKKLEQRYQSDLANGLGNLVQRVLTLIESGLLGEINYLKKFEKPEIKEFILATEEKYRHNMEEFRLHEALGNVFELIGFANAYTNEHKPWELVKDNPDHFLEVMTNLTLLITTTSFWVYPFLPDTAEKVLKSFGLTLQDKIENFDHKKLIIKKGEPMFPRLK
ncbi:MAG: class I tRNA ligase family protein [bacterium]|nr:class I tRNA ligase family protein [bacterium]